MNALDLLLLKFESSVSDSSVVLWCVISARNLINGHIQLCAPKSGSLTFNRTLCKMSDSKLNLDFEDLMDDDKDTIRVSSAQVPNTKLNSPLMRGMELNLSFAADRKDSYDESARIQEQDVLVIFELPDGSQGENRFKLGQTVELLKSFVEIEYGIPMQDQKLYLEDKLMLNPLSLLDYPEAKGEEEIFVRVEGYLPANSKK